MNKVIAIGNLGADVEYKELDSGVQIANFRIGCTDRRRKGADGKPGTEWINVVAFGKLATICNDYLTKGKKIYLEGRLQTRSYEKDGQTKYMTEVIAENIEMLDPKPQGEPKAKSYEEPPY